MQRSILRAGINLLPISAGSIQISGKAQGLPSLGFGENSTTLATSALVINGQPNVNDTLNFNLDNLPRDASGNLAVNTLEYNGGANGWDTLIVTGGTFQTEIYQPTGKDSGIITYHLPDPLSPSPSTGEGRGEGAGQTFTIIFTGLEPVETYGSASVPRNRRLQPRRSNLRRRRHTAQRPRHRQGVRSQQQFRKHHLRQQAGLGDRDVFRRLDDRFLRRLHHQHRAGRHRTYGLVIVGAGDNNMLKANAATELNQYLNGYGDNNTFYAAGGGTYPTDLYGYGGNATYIMPTAGNIYLGGDTDATNTLDFSALSSNVTVDLGSTSSQTAATGLTVMFATSTTITNANGGSGNDTITGNSLDNSIWGGAGDDTLYGKDGLDFLDGGDGTDRLYGGSGNNVVKDGEGEWLVKFDDVPDDSPIGQLEYIESLFHNAGLDAQGVDASQHVGVDGVVIVQADPASSLATVQAQVSGLPGFASIEVWDEDAPSDSRSILVPEPEADNGTLGSLGDPVEGDGSSASVAGLLVSGNGINRTQTTSLNSPPDSDGAAGLYSFVQPVNQSIVIYNKDSLSVPRSGPILFSDFLPQNRMPKNDASLTDPIVVFNEFTDQFFVGMLEYYIDPKPTLSYSYLDVAISPPDSTTLTLSGWHAYRYNLNDGVVMNENNTTEPTPFDWADYPKIGYNREGFVISTNMYPEFGGGAGGLQSLGDFDHSSVLSISSSNPALPITEGNGTNPAIGYGPRAVPGKGNFTLAPASMHTAAIGDPMWLVTDGHTARPTTVGSTTDGFTVIRLPSPFSNAALVKDSNIFFTTIASDFSKPTFAPRQPRVSGSDPTPFATFGNLDTDTDPNTGKNIYPDKTNFGTRFYFSALRTIGTTTHLVTAQMIGNGAGTNFGDSVRWYDINIIKNTNGTYSFDIAHSQSGTINGKDANGADDTVLLDTFFPAAEIAADGSIGISYSQSGGSIAVGAGQFLAMYVAVHLPGTASSSLVMAKDPNTHNLVPAIQSTTQLNAFNRVGDYSFASVDPSPTASVGTFWAVNEYAMVLDSSKYVVTSDGHVHPNNWATWIQEFDFTPPVVSAPYLTDASDTGISSTDNITKLTSLTFVGTAEIGAVVQLMEGSFVRGTATADASGVWSITCTLTANAVHTVFAKATDAAGNVSANSPSLMVTIDTILPSAPSKPLLITADDKGTDNNGNEVTNKGRPTFSGMAEKGATVTLYRRVNANWQWHRRCEWELANPSQPTLHGAAWHYAQH